MQSSVRLLRQPRLLALWRRCASEGAAAAPAPQPEHALAVGRRAAPCALPDAVRRCVGAAHARFDETVELTVRLNVDPRRADQNLRGSLRLPAGVPRPVRTAMFTADEGKAREAREGGADAVGLEDLVEMVKREGGAGVEAAFERVIATPEAMPVLGQVARVLGPRGLMPNSKTGTLGDDVRGMLQRARESVQYRTDKYGHVQLGVGKVSFGEERLEENIRAVMQQLQAAKPEGVKKKYVLWAGVASTMGPGVPIDVASL